MADPSQVATFFDLPTELKAAVFTHIHRNEHRKAVCLVSHEWRNIMAPILWESLSFKISARLPGNPACLGSEDGGVLAHVRFVEIDGRKVNFTGHDRDSDNPIDVEVLQILLRALPRNRLLGIHFNVEIEVDAIRDVLYPQQELQTLEIEQYVSARKSPMQLILAKQGSWVKPALRNIRKLRIPISDEDSNKYENTIYILQNVPRLKRLSLKGAYDCSSLVDDSHKYDAFGGPYRKGEVFKLCSWMTSSLNA